MLAIVNKKKRNFGITRRRRKVRGSNFHFKLGFNCPRLNLFSKVKFPSLPSLPSFQKPASAYDIISSFSQTQMRFVISVMSITSASLMLYLYIFSPNGLIARHRIREQIAKEEAELTEIKNENEIINIGNSKFENDQETIERTARSELNLVYPGESIYHESKKEPPAYVLNYQGNRR